MTDPIFGRLEWDSIIFTKFIQDPSVNEAVASGAGGLVVIGGLISLVLLTYYRLWGPLWRNWLISSDHKRIGIMYAVVGIIMLLRGVAEGFVMRINQAFALNGNAPLAPEHVGELFSTHGTIMVLFVAVPIVFGLINFVVPLQIGARDVAFPVLNQMAFAFTASGAALMMISLVIGEFHTGGWTAYPPYTGKIFSPGVGPDYWIWAIVISGMGTTMGAINIFATIMKCRAPGMKLMHMPIFCWTALTSCVLLVYIMPPLTVASVMLALDRYLDFHFFTNDLGGNMMLYANMFWMFGHPEVYVLILPAYGVYSEITATFSGKRIYGYESLVVAGAVIAVVACLVWLHHFFTMGQSASLNAAFGIGTMLIGIPTGVKIYDWMATLWRGRIRITTPMVYLIGFFILFVLGGLSGIILANPTIDYQVHNTLFLVAHFHNVLIPGVLFGLLAGIYYWFPKAFGFRLEETWGIRSAVLWSVGFVLTFMPLYWVGLLGMPRRSTSFEDPGFVPWLSLSAVGACVILMAIACLVISVLVSIRNRRDLAVPVGDPWDGRTLEWATPCPAPAVNFYAIPDATGRDAWHETKQAGMAYRPGQITAIHMPKSTSIGVITMVTATALGFALVWWIWWLAILSGVLMLGAIIWRSFDLEQDYEIPAADLAAAEASWLAQAERATGVTRDEEISADNRGLAVLEAK